MNWKPFSLEGPTSTFSKTESLSSKISSLRWTLARLLEKNWLCHWKLFWSNWWVALDSCHGPGLGSKSSRMIWGFFILNECSEVDQSLMWSFDGSIIMHYLCKILIGKPDTFICSLLFCVRACQKVGQECKSEGGHSQYLSYFYS